MQGMQFDLDEIFSQAIMTKKPFVIVEGVDDISVYDGIVNDGCKIAEVVAVETIEGYAKGCESVVSAVDFLQDLEVVRYDPRDYVLGIIDKDVRDYRGELPVNDLLLILEAYSIESHFVNSEVVERLLRVCTKGTPDLYTKDLQDDLLSKCIDSMDILYLASLDALRGSLERDYDSDFGYCQKYGRLKDQSLVERLINKREELTEFSLRHSLDHNLDTLKKISKGKWLLSVFCEELEKKMRDLPSTCGEGPVIKCQMCANEVENSCLYRFSEGFTHKVMREIARKQHSVSELSYIRGKVATLASKAA